MNAKKIAAAFRRIADRMDPPPKPAWHALPGGRLELGATGYWIELTPGGPDTDLVLYTPEGRETWKCREWLLDDLKRKAEECAAKRAEFFALEISPAARGRRA